MSKLQIIRAALESNSDVMLLNTREYVEIPSRQRSIFYPNKEHEVYFSVAPHDGLYAVEALQSFMMNLIPDLKPDKKDDFREVKRRMYFGKLFFLENIGEEKKVSQTTITITDEELLAKYAWPNGRETLEKEVSKQYIRGITINPYPNAGVYQEGRYAVFRDSISLRKLKRFQKLIG